MINVYVYVYIFLKCVILCISILLLSFFFQKGKETIKRITEKVENNKDIV